MFANWFTINSDLFDIEFLRFMRMTKRGKLKICLLLHKKLTLQSMPILGAFAKRFVRSSPDRENVQTYT